MDQVAIFKGELTKDDIQQVMNNLEEVLSVSPVGCLTSTWAQVKLSPPALAIGYINVSSGLQALKAKLNQLQVEPGLIKVLLVGAFV